jgi:hypothetical protein
LKKEARILLAFRIPDWNTYLARACITAAGHVGGAVSPGSLFSRNVNSNPKPLDVSGPDTSCTLPSPCKSDKPKLKFTHYITIMLPRETFMNQQNG